MPKRRKKNERNVQPSLLIFCEGGKTEPNYIRAFIRDVSEFDSGQVAVKVVPTKKNTPRELVLEAARARMTDEDELWTVFDKNGYTKHPQAFSLARDKGVNVAFSSMAFEFWILLHFEFTTRPFSQADDLLSYLKKDARHLPDYEKGDCGIYEQIKHATNLAADRAVKVRKHQHASSPFGAKVHELNPYTDVDLLLQAIRDWVG